MIAMRWTGTTLTCDRCGATAKFSTAEPDYWSIFIVSSGDTHLDLCPPCSDELERAITSERRTRSFSTEASAP